MIIIIIIKVRIRSDFFKHLTIKCCDETPLVNILETSKMLKKLKKKNDDVSTLI